MKYNYHTHSYRCNHADGDIRDYVLAAKAAGFDSLGIADHAPQAFRDGYVSKIRMRPDQASEYVNTFLKLESEGHLQHMFIGYELEYFPDIFEDTMEILTANRLDYLILGQHYSPNESGGVYFGRSFTAFSYMKDYLSLIQKALETGYFSYLCHPDLPHFDGSKEDYTAAMHDLCQICKAYHTPMEINLHGWWDKKHYPAVPFWEIASEEGVDVVIGFDAHKPFVLQDDALYQRAFDLIQQYGLHYLSDFFPKKLNF